MKADTTTSGSIDPGEHREPAICAPIGAGFGGRLDWRLWATSGPARRGSPVRAWRHRYALLGTAATVPFRKTWGHIRATKIGSDQPRRDARAAESDGLEKREHLFGGSAAVGPRSL